MKELNYKSEYITLIQHIENNLSSDLNIEFLSNVGFISPAQLYRDFYSLTGHSVKEYVRKRRLSNALALIKASNLKDLSLADIAYQCGYSSQQALCRAVKQTLDITPLTYKNNEFYYFFPPFIFNGEFLQSVTLSNETIPKTHCIKFYNSTLKDIEEKAISKFLSLIPDYSGRIFGRNGTQMRNQFCYEIYITDIDIYNYELFKSHGFEINSEITDSISTTFATSIVQNDESKINAAWRYLYNNWLQNSMFEYTNEPYYEEYLLRNGKPTKLKLYLPIQKRNENTNIALVRNPKLHFIISTSKGYNAEKIASKKVIDYLTKHYPHIMKMSKEFFLRKEINTCSCGVLIDSESQFSLNNSIERFTTNNSYYLVLESNVMGDYEQYKEMLLTFAKNNSMLLEPKEIFAVFDVTESFNNPKLKMYCKINDIKLDIK